MGKIAIVTDSNSGITQDEGRELGISVLPMPFYINDVMYLEGITLSQEEFYEKLKNDEAISTSQPSPAEVCGLWDNLLEEYDEVVHIPMSSGLSAACDTATALSRSRFFRCVGEQFFIEYVFLGSVRVQILEEIQFITDHCFNIGLINVGTAVKTDNCKDKHEKSNQIFSNLHKYLSFQKIFLYILPKISSKVKKMDILLHF